MLPCISAGITDTKLHMKLTKYTKDFKPIKLEQEVLAII